MCMGAQPQAIAAPAPMVPLAPPPPPAPTATATKLATPNVSVAKKRSKRNPLSIQKSDSVSTGLNIPA